MKQSHVISFSPSGVVSYLEKPEFDLGILGRKSIERATLINWREATQKWDVVICGQETEPHPPCSMSFETYDMAKYFEVEWLQKCMLHGVQPLTNEGRVLAAYARITTDTKYEEETEAA